MTATRKYPKPSTKNIETLAPSQRNLLVRTALHVITEKVPPFKMEYYARSESEGTLDVYEVFRGVNECGASCCLMGIAAYVHAEIGGEIGKYELWHEFGQRVLGVSNSHVKNGKFMFDGNWANDRKQAAARVLLWLRGQDVVNLYGFAPMEFNDKLGRLAYVETYLTSYSTAKLVRELKKFLVEE